MTIHEQIEALTDKERATLFRGFGYVKKREPAPKRPVLRPLHEPGAPSFGPSTPKLEAWLEAKHDPDWVYKSPRLPSLGKPPKLGPGKYAEEEARWNDAVRRVTG